MYSWSQKYQQTSTEISNWSVIRDEDWNHLIKDQKSEEGDGKLEELYGMMFEKDRGYWEKMVTPFNWIWNMFLSQKILSKTFHFTVSELKKMQRTISNNDPDISLLATFCSFLWRILLEASSIYEGEPSQSTKSMTLIRDVRHFEGVQPHLDQKLGNASILVPFQFSFQNIVGWDITTFSK